MTVITSYSSDLAQPKLIAAVRVLIYLGIASLMLWVPLVNKSYWVAIIFILFSGLLFQSARTLMNDKVILVSIILALLFTLSLAYSNASWHFSFRAWDKYLKVFYLLFFLPFFIEKKYRNQAVFFLIFSVMVSEVFAYLHYFNVFTFGYPSTKHWLFVQDLDAGYIVSFACYLLASLAFDNKKYRVLYLIGFVICSFDVLMLNVERSGYFIYLALAGLFLWQRFHWKGLLSAMISVPLLFGGLYLGSDKFNSRINQLVTNVSDYQKGNQITSIGLRLTFAKYSFEIIRNHWLIGSGVGSFEENYRALHGPKMNDFTWPAHPHDEYIAILLQLGVIGLLVFLYWIYLQIHASFQLPRQERFFLQALILGFLILSFCNASLLVNPAGACFVTFLSVFLAAKYDGSPMITGRDDR